MQRKNGQAMILATGKPRRVAQCGRDADAAGTGFAGEGAITRQRGAGNLEESRHSKN